VIESDGIWARDNLGIQVRGGGETAWIRNGKVCFTATHLGEMTQQNVRDYTTKTFTDPCKVKT
jgi:hypothetical protein